MFDSYKLIVLIFFVQTTLTLTKPKTTKSANSLGSLILPATTIETPLIEINPKEEDKDAIINLENSLKSVSNMFHSKKKETRHVVRDIPLLFACLEEDSKMEDCCKIDHFRINHVNTFSCHALNLFISINFFSQSTKLNKTLDVYLTINREIENEQDYFDNDGCTWFRVFRVSAEKSFIVYDNKLFESKTDMVHSKLLQKTWEKSYVDYFCYKFKYFSVDEKDSFVYFNTMTYFSLFRDISWISGAILGVLYLFFQAYYLIQDIRNCCRERTNTTSQTNISPQVTNSNQPKQTKRNVKND